MNPNQDQPSPEAIRPDRPPPAGAGTAPENEGALQADRPPDNGQVTATPPAPASEHVTAGAPPAPGRPVSLAHQTGGVVRWTVGLLLIMGFGWGLIILIAVLSRIYRLGVPFDVAAGIAGIASFFLLLYLQQDLWLSRFMGLRLGPRSTPLKEALFFWFLGVVGLLFRSTVPPEAAAQPEPKPEPSEKAKDTTPENQDGFREVVETVVFVVVLVLLLKAFLAEAFVIPTGSMAPTLLGYHRNVTCPQCGHTFSINLSDQLDPERQGNAVITGCTCPNCFLPFNLPAPKGQ